MANKKVAIILSGCGVYDGSEINEVVLTILSLELRNVSYQCFAPDIEQYHVIDHLKGRDISECRNVLTESARIVRGNIRNLKECNPDEFDAVIIPGGFGVAKNLSDFAFKGANLEINAGLLSTLKDFKDKSKPAGYMCIAPVLLPSVYGSGVILTIGNDADTISLVHEMGGVHKTANVDEVVIDQTCKVVSTPAYMLAQSVSEAYAGIDKLVEEVIKLS